METSDDIGVVNATLAWQIVSQNGTLNETTNWNVLHLGPVSETKWEGSLVIPADAARAAWCFGRQWWTNNSCRRR